MATLSSKDIRSSPTTAPHSTPPLATPMCHTPTQTSNTATSFPSFPSSAPSIPSSPSYSSFTTVLASVLSQLMLFVSSLRVEDLFVYSNFLRPVLVNFCHFFFSCFFISLYSLCYVLFVFTILPHVVFFFLFTSFLAPPPPPSSCSYWSILHQFLPVYLLLLSAPLFILDFFFFHCLPPQTGSLLPPPSSLLPPPLPPALTPFLPSLRPPPPALPSPPPAMSFLSFPLWHIFLTLSSLPAALLSCFSCSYCLSPPLHSFCSAYFQGIIVSSSSLVTSLASSPLILFCIDLIPSPVLRYIHNPLFSSSTLSAPTMPTLPSAPPPALSPPEDRSHHSSIRRFQPTPPPPRTSFKLVLPSWSLLASLLTSVLIYISSCLSINVRSLQALSSSLFSLLRPEMPPPSPTTSAPSFIDHDALLPSFSSILVKFPSLILSALWQLLDYSSLCLVGLCRLFTGAVGARGLANCRRPTRPLRLFEFEGCPLCKSVRESLSVLELDHVTYPCPRESLLATAHLCRSRYRSEVESQGGKVQVPFLADPNTGVKMYDSAEIVEYLWGHYGDMATAPVNCRLANEWRVYKRWSLAAQLVLRPHMDMGILRTPSRQANEVH
eukprot:GHVS01045432.1.p1 GENE.GHVS01045432.1~~GHVS01045432.1.p1  ORF type:complete len:617 (+),score=133.10 GHVS01045432.1:31-1851(+)